jgi:NAD(P)-dependent dehydrogenase (short-subunit alcohol dehydrogenase family)
MHDASHPSCGRPDAAYTASKHTVAGLAKSSAFMYGPSGIHVNTVAPGRDREANWLPAPADPFNLTMRMYARSRTRSPANGIPARQVSTVGQPVGFACRGRLCSGRLPRHGLTMSIGHSGGSLRRPAGWFAGLELRPLQLLRPCLSCPAALQFLNQIPV